MTEVKKFKGYVNLSGWSKFMNKKLTFCLILTFLLNAITAAATLNVPSGLYPTIQAAIQQAHDGDTIMIASGIYIGTGFEVNGNNLTITSTFPTDPNRVVIDCSDEGLGGFTLRGSGCELRGLTIANVRAIALNGRNGNHAGDPGDDGGWHIGRALIIAGNHKVTNCIIRNVYLEGGDGGNGNAGDSNSVTKDGAKGGDGGAAAGAGILVLRGSPVIKNTIIEDCNVIGGNGGDGGSGYSNEANSLQSGRGGSGGVAGEGFGAGICVLTTVGISNPTFEDCIIRNCRAVGGNGGNGGNTGFGAEPDSSGGYGGLTYYDPTQDPPIDHSANGGGVYVGLNCTATFTNCTITNSSTDGSISGLGGLSWGGVRQQPLQNTNIPSFGGGIYCAYNSYASFSGCDIQDNNVVYHEDYYSGYGGGLAIVDANSVRLANCNITGNSATVGGGFYGGWIADLRITGSNVLNNFSYIGGGLFINDINNADIFNSVISGNSAEFTSDDFYGSGGGIYCSTSDTQMSDCTIAENTASSSGGGIYIDIDINTVLFNCLITGNKANSDGGGISANWDAVPKIQNCTIANNAITGNGFGGGIAVNYGSDSVIIDSIIWGNTAISAGSQIGLSTGGFADMPSNLNISYSDIDLRTGTDFNSLLLGAGSGSGTTTGVLVDSQAINNEIASAGSAKVIVSLIETGGQTNWSSPASVSTLRSEIATLQNQVLSTLNAGEWTLRHKLTNVAAFSGQITQAGLNKLMTNPSVAHIEPVRYVHPALAQAIPLANALNTRPTYNGSGVSVAIVDSGVDYTHPRLGGGGFPNSKIIGGYDTGSNDANPIPAGEAHGTCCAGIAAGMLGTVGDYIGGVAPNAKIYALKAVTDTGEWPTDSTLAAWDWCITHRNDNPANPIMVISNSWGYVNLPFNNSAEADAYSPAHTTAAQTAVNAGITILAASGNDGFAGQGISWPSAMSNVISVGAVYDTTDQVTDYSNTAENLDILAPADPVYTTDIVGAGGYDPGDYFPSFNGTSSACPFAAGSVAVIQSAAMQLTGEYLMPSQVRTLLKITGDSVTDTKVAITKPRVNVGAAIALLSSSVPIYSETGCTITGLTQDANGIWGIDDNNNISEYPNFVLGYWGNYYLSQIITNNPLQTVDSNCVDAGLGSAISNGMYRHTTRTDHVIDIADSNVDMGYHYLLNADLLGDLNYDGVVDFKDFALFAENWLQTGCEPLFFCYDRDLNQDGSVNTEDLMLFAENWLKTETNPPVPNPMTWAVRPQSTGANSIKMVATTAMDSSSGSQVRYFFQRFSGSTTTDLGWFLEPNYIDRDVIEGTQYGYRVKAKDERDNETGWSDVNYATPSEDTNPPQPDPMTWATAPYATSSSSIRMVATEANDACGPPEYYFIEISGRPGANDSNWQSSTTYEDVGLDPCTTYTYQVKARDKSLLQNETQFSAQASATTDSDDSNETDPPEPNLSTWASVPQAIQGLDANYPSRWYHFMMATTATDASPPVMYSFDCVVGTGFSSGWIETPFYISGPYLNANHSAYKVRTKDSLGNIGSYSQTYHTYWGYLD